MAITQRHLDIETNMQTGRQTYRHTIKETSRQTSRQTHTEQNKKVGMRFKKVRRKNCIGMNMLNCSSTHFDIKAKIWLFTDMHVNYNRLREAAKNVFFSGPASSLVATKNIQNFYESFKKRSFFLVAKPLPPLPLSGRDTKKIPFFAASLI